MLRKRYLNGREPVPASLRAAVADILAGAESSPDTADVDIEAMRRLRIDAEAFDRALRSRLATAPPAEKEEMAALGATATREFLDVAGQLAAAAAAHAQPAGLSDLLDSCHVRATALVSAATGRSVTVPRPGRPASSPARSTVA